MGNSAQKAHRWHVKDPQVVPKPLSRTDLEKLTLPYDVFQQVTVDGLLYGRTTGIVYHQLTVVTTSQPMTSKLSWRKWESNTRCMIFLLFGISLNVLLMEIPLEEIY